MHQAQAKAEVKALVRGFAFTERMGQGVVADYQHRPNESVEGDWHSRVLELDLVGEQAELSIRSKAVAVSRLKSRREDVLACGDEWSEDVQNAAMKVCAGMVASVGSKILRERCGGTHCSHRTCGGVA